MVTLRCRSMRVSGRAPSDQRHKENPTARAAIASAAMTRAGLRCPGTRARLLED